MPSGRGSQSGAVRSPSLRSTPTSKEESHRIAALGEELKARY